MKNEIFSFAFLLSHSAALLYETLVACIDVSTGKYGTFIPLPPTSVFRFFSFLPLVSFAMEKYAQTTH